MSLLDKLESAAAARGFNTTKDWQIRCTKCNRAAPLAKVGGVRIGGRGRKYTLAYCRQCRWLRVAVIERVPTDVSAPAAS